VSRASPAALGAATCAISASALAVAGVAYVALREGLRLHRWAGAVMGSDAIARLRSVARSADLPAWVRFNLPDALWQLALCLVVFRIWRGARWSAARIVWCGIASTLGVAIELAQRAHLIEGTYDPADVVASIAAVVAAACASTIGGAPTLR
jgi:hypothetical protein